ncbi:hypothetical protein Tco_1062869, partial [Tanacetum coccineum]
HSKLNVNSELKCVKCNGCMLSDNHDLCVLDFINNVNARVKSKSVKKIGNVCPLTRITTTTKVPLRKSTALENETPKPVVTLVYSRKPRKSKTNIPVSKSMVLKFVSANKKEPSQSWGSIVSDVPSSSLDDCRSSKLFSVKFGNDHVAKILGYGDYQIGNVTIITPEPAASTGLPSSTIVCQDAPSPSNSQTTLETQSPIIPNDVEEENHDVDVSHMNNDPFFGISIPENKSEVSSSLDVIPTFVHTAAPTSEHVTKWTMDHPLDNIIGELERHVSIRLQLHERMTRAKPPPSTPFVPPSRTDWDILFQPLFDELLTPPPSVDHPAPEVIAPIAEVVAPEPAASTSSPSSTTVDQDAPCNTPKNMTTQRNTTWGATS